jgi:transcription antitermination factor NusA-like protein
MNNELIEVIEYSDNIGVYLKNICSPAQILGFEIDKADEEGSKQNIAIVCKSDVIPLLIGFSGVNVKIISQLLNSTIEVLSDNDAQQMGLNFTPIIQTQQRGK